MDRHAETSASGIKSSWAAGDEFHVAETQMARPEDYLPELAPSISM
jgi:hypothetical protein